MENFEKKSLRLVQSEGRFFKTGLPNLGTFIALGPILELFFFKSNPEKALHVFVPCRKSISSLGILFSPIKFSDLSLKRKRALGRVINHCFSFQSAAVVAAFEMLLPK